ncbi:glycosyltransferase family 2 protein [Plantactinospora sonchi]|uniref:Glycosyltransferase family 2 protein n=1 Tax=Plantactinospora sonchi TaxID=1544735 RepID=A0ABU7RTB1_9ACTN
MRRTGGVAASGQGEAEAERNQMRTGEHVDPAAAVPGTGPEPGGLAAPGSPDRAERGWWWRLVDAPPPTRAERLGRWVGLRVLRIPGRGRLLVVAGSVDRLRDLLTMPVSITPTRRTTVLVAYWRAPWRGWAHGIGPLDHLRRHRVTLPRGGRGPASVAVRLSRPARLRDVVRAALAALTPDRPLPAPASAELTCWDTLPGYLPAGPVAVLTGPRLPAGTEIRAHDLVLWAGDRADSAHRVDPVAEPPGKASRTADPVADTPGPASRPADSPPGAGSPSSGDVEPAYAVGWHAGRHGLRTDAGPVAVLVDARRVNPRGRRADSYRPDAPRIRLDFVSDPRGRRRPGAGRLDGPGLTAADLATLRQVGTVDCGTVPDADPVAVAALLVQVAMTGATLSAPTLPDRVAGLLTPELRETVGAPVPQTDPLAREARSVRQRRAALRGHATGFALPRLAAAPFPGLPRPPSVSAILATRRPDLLPEAVRTIVGQTYPELEVVLCLHGCALPEPVRDLLAASGRPYEIVEVPGALSFGEALGAATGRARGSLVTKFDDDDSYGPEHVWDLVLARHYSGATVVGKGSEFVHLETLDVTIRRPSGAAESDAEVVAGGTMLIARGDLESVGGWRPVPRSVDLGLLRRVRRDGGIVYRTHPFGYVYHRRATGHTWDPGQEYFLESAYARWPGLPAELLDGPVPPSGADRPVTPPGHRRPGSAGPEHRG